MGHEQRVKEMRRQARKALGSDAGYLALQSFEILHMRTFWGRLKWLFLGR